MQPDFVYTLTTPTGVQQRIPITLVEEHGSISVPDTFTPPDWACCPIPHWVIRFKRSTWT